MDKRKRYYVMLDTETCPLDRDFEQVTPQNMFVYDCGFAVVDRHGEVYEAHSFIIDEIFNDEKVLMSSAYYADKIPQYKADIESGKRIVASWNTVRETLAEVMEKYNTNIVIAHNARFDDGSLKNTQRWLTKSKYRYFLPKGTEIWDTLKMATDVIAPMPTYQAFCKENGFMTSHKKPRPRLTAEVIYKFLTHDLDFVESHTGLEDVMIEKDIFAYCMAKHKKMRKTLYANA